MNSFKCITEHRSFLFHPLADFEFRYQGIDIKIANSVNKLMIELIGDKSREKLMENLFDILSLCFLILGGYPEIMSVDVNGEFVDTSDFLGYFATAKHFCDRDMGLGKIDITTINEQTMDNWQKMKIDPLKSAISSLKYLVSEDYSKIIMNHRITLLLHIIDGIVTENMANEYKSKYLEKCALDPTSRISTYSLKVYYLVNDFARLYPVSDILSLLNVDLCEFVKVITDTRHWNSHFLEESKKENRLKDGAEMLFYFNIIYICIRLHLLGLLKIATDSSKTNELLYLMHDWILDSNQINGSYKSERYQISESCRKVFELLRQSDNNL